MERTPRRSHLAALGIFLVSAAAPVDALDPASIGGVGIMGDSVSDEYRADDNRGGAYASVTFNWAELLAREGYDLGAWGTRASPRRTGYEYNWALSGSRAADVLADGQHTGVAAQVAAGKVKNVVFQIGANDFAPWNGTYDEIYDGTLSDADVAAKVSAMVAAITTAVDTVRAAGPVRLVVANLADRGNSPHFVALYPDATRRQRVTDAIVSVNQGIAAMAAARNIPVADLYGMGSALLARVDANGNYSMAGALITFASDGDEPHHALLGDSEHTGTVFGGVLANTLFLDPFARVFGLPLLPMTETEMLLDASITPPAPLTGLSVVPATVAPGASATLSWNATHATAASIGPGIGAVALSGSMTVSPPTTTTYTLTTTNGTSTVDRKSVTVTVQDVQPATFTPSAYSVAIGSRVSGSVANVAAADGSFLVIRSTTNGNARSTDTRFTVTGIQTLTPTRIAVTYRALSSASATSFTLQAYNAATQAWLTLDAAALGTSAVTRTATVSAGAAQLVSSGRQVLLRLQTSRGTTTHNASYDLVSVTVTP